MQLRFLLLLFTILPAIDPVAQTLVWSRPEGGERNEYLFFRREFQLKKEPDSAFIHLYADSRYALYVNGAYVNFGPARSFHANPRYDTYDLRPYCRLGENVIAVQVLSNGMETFQLFDFHGAFTAWGKIELPAKTIDLDVTNGWRCRPSTGYDATAPRFSFATGAMENWDARGEGDWNRLRTITTGWRPPVVLRDQARFGNFAPRPIPHLTQDKIRPLRRFGAYAMDTSETIFSLRISTPDANMREYGRGHPARGLTYIHSPRAQSVRVGLWWGDHYLNGERLRPAPDQTRESYRRDYVLELRNGWNEFTMGYNIIWGSWDFYMAVPKSAELHLSPDRRLDDVNWFATYGPFPETNGAGVSEVDPARPIDQLRRDRDWQLWQRDRNANQPARDLAWSEPDRKKSLSLSETAAGEVILPPQPGGSVLFYAMPEIVLGRFYVEGDFPAGTRIDLGFSEELDERGEPWLYKRFQIGAGLRFVADGEREEYASFKPYGAKYLRLQFSNYEDTLRLRGLGMIRQQYPFRKIGDFRCDDPLMNRIWEAGWRTLQLCAEDTYTDTPFRERGLYAGDMLPEVMITAAVSGDLRLAKHSLAVFQDMYRAEMREGTENRHNDFPLITLLTADYVARYTGDRSLVSSLYDNYRPLLRHHLRKRDQRGLIPAQRVFIEWTDLHKGPGAMTAYQALNVRALETLADWADQLSRQEDAAFFGEAAAVLRDSVNVHLLNKENRRYFDGFTADSLITNQHLTSSVWPALYGLTDSPLIPELLDWLGEEIEDIGGMSRKRKITPYSSFYLFTLLYRHGRADLAEAFMRRRWGPMALHSDRPTVWENFDINGNQGTSSHAWSGHPTFFLATEALGVNLGWTRPLSRDTVVIAPHSATLNWAEGTVAHPTGPVWVRWEVKGERLHLQYRAPEGVEVLIEPRGRLAELELLIVDL